MIRIGQTRLEWALLGLIAVVFTGLSFLQYRWTGEFSRAERLRLRSGLDEQVGRQVRAFDEEIREGVLAEAHGSRYEQWASSHERSPFAAIGIALDMGDSGYHYDSA